MPCPHVFKSGKNQHSDPQLYRAFNNISCEILEFPAGNARVPAGKNTPCFFNLYKKYLKKTGHQMICVLFCTTLNFGTHN